MLTSLGWLPHKSDSPREAAIAYATHGWAVFPCAGKKPINADGFKGATSNPTVAKAMWSANPTANIGWSLPVGSFALDVDPRHKGDESLRALEGLCGPLPWTLRARTGGGGEHWIYRVPEGVELRQMAGFKPGLDTRLGGRGYLLISPSVHPETKRSYEWFAHFEPQLPPAWLVDLIRAPKVEPRPVYVAPSTWNAEQDRRRKYGLVALKGCADDVRGAGKGERNNGLNKAWFRMLQLRDAVSVDEIRAALTDAALTCGLADSEIRKVLR